MSENGIQSIVSVFGTYHIDHITVTLYVGGCPNDVNINQGSTVLC